MSSRKRLSKSIPSDAKRNKKMDDYSHQVDKTWQNDPSHLQTSSEKYPKDKTNFQAEGPRAQAMSATKTVKVTLEGGGHRAYEVRGNGRASLYEVLTNESGDLKETIDSQKGKEMLVLGVKGIDGFINPGMPLSCFLENCHVKIIFVESEGEQEKENQVFGRFDQGSGKCVKFYIHAIGKEIGETVKLGQPHRKGDKLCIYAFKGETIRQALCKDGRFCPSLSHRDWKLIENGATILESTQLVDDLEERVFEVEFEKKPTSANTTENAEPQNRSTTPLNEAFVEQRPSLRSEKPKIKENLQQKETNSNTSLFKFNQTKFGEMTKNPKKVEDLLCLIDRSNSVGYMEWISNGEKGFATCFVFIGPYIITARHVLFRIVGTGTELSNWKSLISQRAWVTFSYLNPQSKENNKFFIDASFLFYGITIDYAILKLQGNGQGIPPGLYHCIGSVPSDGRVNIISHPNGEGKEIDSCLVMPRDQQEKECLQHVPKGSLFAHMYTGKIFQEILNNPDMIMYKTSFYSSGSPLFDSSGALVAIHNADFAYEDERGTSSNSVFGPSMKSILLEMYQSEDGRCWLDEIKVDLSGIIVKDVETVSVEED